jgi:small subunit ribosomal protein S3Ae
MAKTKKVVKQKIKKKKWFQVVAPELFRSKTIGEIPLYEAEQMQGRNIKINMMALTGNPRNQQTNVFLRVSEIKEGKGMTGIMGLEVMPSSIKRYVRKGRTKIADSIVIKTKDDKKVRIKPLIITKARINKPTSTNVRIRARNEMIKLAQKLTFEKLVEEIIHNKFQKHVYSNITKISPIKQVEIRAFKIVEREGVEVQKIASEKEVKKVSRKDKKQEIVIEEEPVEETETPEDSEEQEADESEESEDEDTAEEETEKKDDSSQEEADEQAEEDSEEKPKEE